jgi:hypothetical protein
MRGGFFTGFGVSFFGGTCRMRALPVLAALPVAAFAAFAGAILMAAFLALFGTVLVARTLLIGKGRRRSGNGQGQGEERGNHSFFHQSGGHSEVSFAIRPLSMKGLHLRIRDLSQDRDAASKPVTFFSSDRNPE